jgi:hypothetical protein
MTLDMPGLAGIVCGCLFGLFLVMILWRGITKINSGVRSTFIAKASKIDTSRNQ